MRRRSSVGLVASRLKGLNFRRGLFRIWMLAAIPIAGISVMSSIEKYQVDASRYNVWKGRVTVNEATERCIEVVNTLKDTRPIGKPLPSRLEEYFEQLRASAEIEHADLLRLSEQELRVACQRRAEHDEHVALTWDKAHAPSLRSAVIQALLNFTTFAIVPVAGALALGGVGFVLIRWLANGFKP